MSLDIKVGVCGRKNSGKSAVVTRIIQNTFYEVAYDPTVDGASRVARTMDTLFVTVELLDTSGSEEYEALRDCFYRVSDCFLMTYDITDRNSFEEIPSIVERMLTVKDRDDLPPVVLIGCKADLEDQREVDREEGRNLAADLKIKFYETSAKLGTNMHDAFDELVKQTVEWIKIQPPVPRRRVCRLM